MVLGCAMAALLGLFLQLAQVVKTRGRGWWLRKRDEELWRGLLDTLHFSGFRVF